MSRRLRVEFPGAIYHVINQGNRCEDIFRDDADRERFLETLEEACLKADWWVHSYCLMKDHFHLVLETPNANLVAGMKWFLGTYTSRFNHRHRIHGHLFAGRYKSMLVGGEGGYLKTVSDYVHLNPARAGVIDEDRMLRDYAWSSFPQYLKGETDRPSWLRVRRVMGEHGITNDDSSSRKAFEKRVESRRKADTTGDFEVIRKSWCFGDETFRKSVIGRIGERRGSWIVGPEFKESSVDKAQRLIEQELRETGWTERDLQEQRKGHPLKVQIAAKLRNETTVTMQWIADRLIMGSRSHLVHLMYWRNKEKPKPRAPRGGSQRIGNAKEASVKSSVSQITRSIVGPDIRGGHLDSTQWSDPDGFDVRFD